MFYEVLLGYGPGAYKYGLHFRQVYPVVDIFDELR